MADIAELSPAGRRPEARAVMLNTWHRLLHVHDHLDLNDPESSAIADVTTLIADKIEEIEGKRPRRRAELDAPEFPGTCETCGASGLDPDLGSEDGRLICDECRDKE